MNTSENKMYRIVTVINLKNGKRITDHNPLSLYYNIDHAKEGLKNFYKNYIDALPDEIKKQVSVFWSAEEDEVIIKENDKPLAKSEIYEVEYVMEGDPVSNFIIKYRGCTVERIEGTAGLYGVISADKVTVSCKSNIGESLNFIDWLVLIVDEDDDE